MKELKKLILSPFLMVYVVLALMNKDTNTYMIFKELNGNKSFYKWQWSILDKLILKQ